MWIQFGEINGSKVCYHFFHKSKNRADLIAKFTYYASFTYISCCSKHYLWLLMNAHQCSEGETIKTSYLVSFESVKLHFLYNTGSVNLLFMVVFMFLNTKYNKFTLSVLSFISKGTFSKILGLKILFSMKCEGRGF